MIPDEPSGRFSGHGEVPFEARRHAERGWYVVDPVGHLVHVSVEGGLRAAFYGDDAASAKRLAAQLNREHGLDSRQTSS